MKTTLTFSTLLFCALFMGSCSEDSNSYGDEDARNNTPIQQSGNGGYGGGGTPAGQSGASGEQGGSTGEQGTSSGESTSSSTELTDNTIDITNVGASSYVFNSDDFDDAQDPDLTLKRGTTYTFNISAPGHPFFIKEVQSTSSNDTFDEGVSNNGASDGAIIFEVPMSAPDTLFYNCEFHLSMTGIITIVD